MVSKIKRIFITTFLVLLVIVIVLLQLVKAKVNDNSVPVAAIESIAPNGGSVLVVFPHPDDEVSISGTLKSLSDAGIETNYLCLTRGEKGSRPKTQTAEELVAERRAELEGACRILDVKTLVQDTLPDGGMEDVSNATIEASILRAVKYFKPETILTYDTNKGLYGHRDHIRTARSVERLCQQHSGDADFSVKQVLGTTQPHSLMDLLMQLSPKFKKRFYKVNGLDLPQADFSVNVFATRQAKEELFVNYNKRTIISNLLPHKKFLPSVVFHYIHNRDYLYSIWDAAKTGSVYDAELVYSCDFDDDTTLQDWVMEGPGVAQIVDGQLQLNSKYYDAANDYFVAQGTPFSGKTNDYSQAVMQAMQADGLDVSKYMYDGAFRGGHLVYWNTFLTPDNYILECDFQSLSDNALHMLMFSCTGKSGESVFDESLAERWGVAAQYTKGDLYNYRISFFAPGRGASNMRKCPGRRLTVQGEDYTLAAPKASHHLKVVKYVDTVEWYIDGQLSFRFVDDLEDGALEAGETAIRLMTPAKGLYDNYKIYKITGVK